MVKVQIQNRIYPLGTDNAIYSKVELDALPLPVLLSKEISVCEPPTANFTGLLSLLNGLPAKLLPAYAAGFLKINVNTIQINAYTTHTAIFNRTS